MRTFWEISRDEKAKNWREFVTGWLGGGVWSDELLLASENLEADSLYKSKLFMRAKVTDQRHSFTLSFQITQFFSVVRFELI